MRNTISAIVPLLLALSGTSAYAQAEATSAIKVIISGVGQRDADGSILIDLCLLNGSPAPADLSLADRIQVLVTAGGVERRVWIERDAGAAAAAGIAPGGFVQRRYRLREPAGTPINGALLFIPALTDQKVVVNERPYSGFTTAFGPPAPFQAEDQQAPPLAAPPPEDRSAGNQFVGNFGVHEPIYAVYGPGANSQARIQVSFKYHLFGVAGHNSPGAAREGLYFAYTQRMFWDLGADSSPFRNIDFQPELFYQSPSGTLVGGASVSAQAGISHESNGRDGVESRSLNSFYFSPMAAIPLGDGYRITVAPRLALMIGDLSDNPDIRRYRGNGALAVEIGKDDGLRLATITRYNVDTGKGAFSAGLSYPLPRLFHALPSAYLFGQGFVGYGENLLDYDRQVTRFRIGLAFVR